MEIVLSPVDPERDIEQLSWIDGFPAAGTRFKLTSASNLWTDRKLQYRDHVEGRFSGTVMGVQTRPDKDGSLLYCYIIEVLDADLG